MGVVMKTKKEILLLAEKFCKADHCKASFYKGYREAQKETEVLNEKEFTKILYKKIVDDSTPESLTSLLLKYSDELHK